MSESQVGVFLLFNETNPLIDFPKGGCIFIHLSNNRGQHLLRSYSQQCSCYHYNNFIVHNDAQPLFISGLNKNPLLSSHWVYTFAYIVRDIYSFIYEVPISFKFSIRLRGADLWCHRLSIGYLWWHGDFHFIGSIWDINFQEKHIAQSW